MSSKSRRQLAAGICLEIPFQTLDYQRIEKRCNTKAAPFNPVRHFQLYSFDIFLLLVKGSILNLTHNVNKLTYPSRLSLVGYNHVNIPVLTDR